MKIKRFVRQSLFLILVGIGSVPHGVAETLPPIDTHRFESLPVQMSSSGRVYRFSMKSADVPRVGNIVLVQDQKKPSMAFRVIKSDPNKKEYIGRRVRRYDDHQKLELHRFYKSIEKVADKINAPPLDEPGQNPPEEAPTPEAEPVAVATPMPAPPQPRVARVRRPAPTPTPVPEAIVEPESTPEPLPEPPVSEIVAPPIEEPEPNLEVYDQNLDASTTPPTEPLPNYVDEDDHDVISAYEIDETKRFDTNRNMITVAPGTYRNASDFVLGGELFSGFTASYSKKLRDDWFIRNSAAPQDSVWLEFGLSHYRKANQSNDIYTLLPLRAELRWEINFSQTLVLDFYGGIQYNLVIGKENFIPGNAAHEAILSRLDGLQPTFGFGIMFNLGPQWYLRSDLGYDRINLGLGVKW